MKRPKKRRKIPKLPKDITNRLIFGAVLGAFVSLVMDPKDIDIMLNEHLGKGYGKKSSEDLKESLDKAVKEENYELAAEIKKLIDNKNNEKK